MDSMFYNNDSSIDNEPDVGNTVIDYDYTYHIGDGQQKKFGVDHRKKLSKEMHLHRRRKGINNKSSRHQQTDIYNSCCTCRLWQQSN